MPSRRHELLAVAVPKLRRSRELDTPEAEKARLLRWHATLDRGFPTRVVPFFNRRYAVVREDLPAGFASYTLTRRGTTHDRTVVYLHGGGFVAPIDPFQVRYGARLASGLGARVVMPDYPLTPEHTWRDAHGPIVELVERLLHEGEDVTIAGDSAGGGLAVATLLAAREQGLPQPAAVAAFSPWADLTLAGASMRSKDGADPLFSYAAMGWYADRYIPNGDRSAPLASPVFASLAGLPPLLVQVGSHEVLLDDAVRLAAAAGRDDVDVTLRVAPEGTHVFQLYFGALDEADEALDEVARFFARHLRYR